MHAPVGYVARGPTRSPPGTRGLGRRRPRSRSPPTIQRPRTSRSPSPPRGSTSCRAPADPRHGQTFRRREPARSPGDTTQLTPLRQKRTITPTPGGRSRPPRTKHQPSGDSVNWRVVCESATRSWGRSDQNERGVPAPMTLRSTNGAAPDTPGVFNGRVASDSRINSRLPDLDRVTISHGTPRHASRLRLLFKSSAARARRGRQMLSMSHRTGRTRQARGLVMFFVYFYPHASWRDVATRTIHEFATTIVSAWPHSSRSIFSWRCSLRFSCSSR